MIKIVKGQPPDILREKAQEWTAQLVAAIADGQATDNFSNRYRHADVKKALIEETKGKCAYCETRFLHVSYGDIEHILPKTPNPQLTFEWANLTLACDVCNTKKARHLLVNPYVDEPEAMFDFLGPMLVVSVEDGRALLTEFVLELNRTHLIGKRVERLENLRRRIREIERSASREEVDAFRSALLEVECANDAEFAACVRVYVRKAGLVA